MRKVIFAAALLVATSIANAAVILTENFDNIGTLAGAGWSQVNNSTPGGVTGWFQGNDGVFAAQAGASNSYIGANFLNAGIGGDISNWLLTPTVSLFNGEKLTFYTKANGAFPDRLEVRLSQNGASGNVGATTSSVGDFSTLLLAINPGLAGDGYPIDWTAFTVTLSGVTDGILGRLAFRYFVNDTNNNADYIGIDSVSVTVPEPSMLMLFALALGAMSWTRRRGSRASATRN